LSRWSRPGTLPRALAKLGFVQADPIRAPARAQDLTLRHRVRDYRVGELARRYPKLVVEEDFFVNYGFVLRELHALMHPRQARRAWSSARWAQAHEAAAPPSCADAREGTAAICGGRWPALVLAGRRKAGKPPPHGGGRGETTGALRSGGLGPPTLRGFLGLGLPLRGLYAGIEAEGDDELGRLSKFLGLGG
jgi:hypothetical protein